MKWFIVALVVCATAPMVFGATGNVEWCYHLPECNYTKWPEIAPQHCSGNRQSPINIVSANATGDSSLWVFTFYGFDSTAAMTKIENTGKTVKVTLAGGVGVEGGGLSERYDSLQFHLHWGNGSSVPGSEHTVDGKRYPMELHIVNLKSSHHGNTTAGIADSTGLAALGFFIDVMSGNATGQPEAWRKLTSYLHNITLKGQSVAISSAITLNQLLSGVDRTKYYRYLGSLTTPTCNEAVVWTVFKEPLKVSKDLIDLFSTTVHVDTTASSPLMIDVYRGIQPDLAVRTQSTTGSGSTFKPSYTLGIVTLILALGRN
ncbi:carbonic anhydrase 4-like [Sphaeramia orbicularis]|uniref:Carbonic anhydrase n=1 Tax=Sphaeramia orbicularis TaxID=375764 RepID=A0A673AIS1_9TELE|nr:carbonic anhydrase 4-like [Sphaeramia orbicularis]